MKNISKLVAIAGLGILMSACSQTYKIKSETGKVMNQVPKWYMAEYSEKKACDTKTFGKGKDKMCIFGVATAVSPDLQLAIEKAILIAKADLADQLQGEMNKRTELYTTEVGSNQNKEVASKIESTIVNVIKKTMVQGYETWEKAVYETPVGTYRVYIGLKMGVGDANRLAEYIAENANKDVDVDALADEAIEEVL